MGHLVCPEEDAEGITWSTDRRDRRSEEERERVEYDINVGEMKGMNRERNREGLENWSGMETEKERER